MAALPTFTDTHAAFAQVCNPEALAVVDQQNMGKADAQTRQCRRLDPAQIRRAGSME